MQGATDAQELRALQRKAYGRDGGLTEAETQRLRALEDARRTAPEPTPRMDVEDEGVDVLEDAAAPAEEASERPVEAEDDDAPHAPEPLRGTLRRHATTLAAVTAVVLAIGVGVGWALFAPHPASIPLTDQQLQRRAELSAAQFDPGSVRAIAEDGVALVWYATRDGGETFCLVLDVGEQSQSDCAPQDESERGLVASLPLPVEDGEGSGVSGNVQAVVYLSPEGEPIVGLQRWGPGGGLTAQLGGADGERAAGLIDEEGYELGLSLAGRFRGAPVWLGDRLSAQGATERCLIVDAAGAVVCDAFETAVSAGLGVHIVDVDPGGGLPTVAVLELRFTTMQTPYLTVTTDTEAVGVAGDDSFLVHGPEGDPIRVEGPNGDLDG